MAKDTSKNKMTTKDLVLKLAVSGIMAALCYVGYAVFPPINAAGTKIHLGNAFVVLGSLILGVPYGGVAGAVGLTLADLIGGHAASAPRTFITKLVIGLIAGAISQFAFKLSEKQPYWKVVVGTVVAAIASLGFNCVFEPALKYVWFTLLTPNADKAAEAIAAFVKLTSIVTFINAIINSALAIVFYLALRTPLTRLGVIKRKNREA